MESTTFDNFFAKATGCPPYGYQSRLAQCSCESRLINIPTGLGKTAAVVLAWLWNRAIQPDLAARAKWPRRLVYCLPMRTLVEQTEKEVNKWVGAHGLLWDGDSASRSGKVGVHILMGGEDSGEWDIYPEENAILIGTQDMLLSRALNRGYGMSRYRWPMHFGLLNNDCLWVLDETQLMGPGLGTACQLEAFRNTAPQGFDSFHPAGSVTWYMSATNNADLLLTREWRDLPCRDDFLFDLTNEEKQETSGPIHKRRSAVKRLDLKSALHFGNAAAIKTLVNTLLEGHQAMLEAIGDDASRLARTLIICNTVDRAVAVHQELATQQPGGCDLLLLHSRFRPPERREQMKRLGSVDRVAFPKGQIVVATQVIEAGVDVSSGILCSEVAPLASLVQRLGRLNRSGEFNASNWTPLAIVVGIDLPALPKRADETAAQLEDRRKDSAHLPYDHRKSEAAWTTLELLNGNASPAALEQPQIRDAVAASIPRCPYSLQRHELLDFFDTDANLSLGFTDVSPFVRGLDEDTDIQVLWRESWTQEGGKDGAGKPDFTPDFQRDELCSVPIGKALEAREILNHGWIWRGKDSGWLSVRDAGLAPGMTVLLPLDAGGYDEAKGWTGDDKHKPLTPAYKPREWSSDEDQLSSQFQGWQSIAVHTEQVGRQLDDVLAPLAHLLAGELCLDALRAAVPWHDIGKNYAAWQQAVVSALEKADITGKDAHKPFGKFSLSDSPHLRHPDGSPRYSGKELYRELKKLSRTFRPGVAHEVASALAYRQSEQSLLGPARDTEIASLLTEYLIMSHHGRVRKVLRDEIPRLPECRDDTETVRGVVHNSPLPAVTIGGRSLGSDSLSTDCRKMGREIKADGSHGHESYTRGVLRLLNDFGPFRLALLEAVFRAADCRASARAVAAPPPSSNLPMLGEDQSTYGEAAALSPEERALVEEVVLDGLAIQHKFRPEPLYKLTGKGHYTARTVEEMQKAPRPSPAPES